MKIGFLSLLIAPIVYSAEDSPSYNLHRFERVPLTNVYFSEGANAGDFDNDGVIDAVYGPNWYAGPDFKAKHLIYKTLPQPMEGYANHFFAWPYDFNGDGRLDIFTVGFPGTPAHVYENPGKEGDGQPWTKHPVFDWVSNESPQFTDLVGDEKPELVCTRDGFFGFASIHWDAGFEAWTFHPISERVAHDRFGHGLGVGDVNGDGRRDVLMQSGWFEQPADLNGDPLWAFHAVPFAPIGGADMFAYDVDGDGDNDVITSLAAHAYGLSWFEQTPDGFTEHLIMGDRAGLNKYGVVFSELHSVALADMDGDGLKDIVTGKTYWSHHKQAPAWDAGAVVYWFKLARGKDGVDWIPMKADGEAGIGRQVVVTDVNGDRLPDIVVGGMLGGHVLLHRTQEVDETTWRAAQPKAIEMMEKPAVQGKAAPIDAATGSVSGALEGETLAVRVSKGSANPQGMKGFGGSKWSGDSQLFWTGGAEGETLAFTLNAPESGDFVLESVFTRAPDYAIVQLVVNGKDVGEPIDLYDFAKVATTGVLEIPLRSLEAGSHTIGVRITGVNPNAAPSRYVGLDYIRLVRAE
jgi:hypothetical protein